MPVYDYKLGDVNDDSKIDALDASLTLLYYAEASVRKNNTAVNTDAADVNKGGKITAVDASYILSYYAATSTDYNKSLEVFVSEN